MSRVERGLQKHAGDEQSKPNKARREKTTSGDGEKTRGERASMTAGITSVV